ncbi:hypothetical protein [Nocardioides lianchengensis]|uniref:Uncharacterized protein n=1 Tax=Nocardioides lianchengensis TaxID=1045774 RepID=A0A1G6LU02_9ACTN|nr:hypothetical protein [Nocardioides lianchengensis]NYG12448.1 hypothetical protein [Nocardioides lianchengensis]SDC46574.1 hypothetical protein SAMN05421872_102356 [Nocardioides lianchengensis]
MSVAERVLGGLGAAFRRRAGEQLTPLVEGLTDPLDRPAALVQPTARGWAAAFDLEQTPDPAWLGRATGTPIPDGLTTEKQRDLVRTRSQWRRGTPRAIKGAVQTVLTGATKRVDVLERTDDPWTFKIRVWASEAPEDLPDVIAVAATQKPVGLRIDPEVEVVDHDATFAHLTEVHGTFAELAEAFPTLGSMTPHVPEEGTIF